MLADLLERFRRGDRLALARLLSLAGRGEQVEEISGALASPSELARSASEGQVASSLALQARGKRPARIIAVTGSGGVGKSTLVGKLIEIIRSRGQTVAVLACDPESPLSGGALLGDRFRMPSRPDDDGVFIRSLAARSGHGAVADHLDVMLRLLEAFGFDVILIETAGAGQGDTAVRELADVVVLLLQPETGDDLQWEKAGVLEVADVVVIHKADLPGAERVESQVRAILGLSEGRQTPVLRVSAKTGAGLEQLWEAITACPPRPKPASANGRDLLHLAQTMLADRFAAAEASQDPGLKRLVAQWRQGQLGDGSAAAALLRLLEELRGSPNHG
jgi:LAO/AO transport system ATPase